MCNYTQFKNSSSIMFYFIQKKISSLICHVTKISLKTRGLSFQDVNRKSRDNHSKNLEILLSIKKKIKELGSVSKATATPPFIMFVCQCMTCPDSSVKTAYMDRNLL